MSWKKRWSYVLFHEANHHKNNVRIRGDAKYSTSIVWLLRKINVENINFPHHDHNVRYHAFDVNPWMMCFNHDNMESSKINPLVYCFSWWTFCWTIRAFDENEDNKLHNDINKKKHKLHKYQYDFSIKIIMFLHQEEAELLNKRYLSWANMT